MRTSQLPPELQEFAALLDAQPGPVQVAFQYAMCLLMVEKGKMRLVETQPGENGAMCIFETLVGDKFTFTVLKPPILVGSAASAQLDLGFQLPPPERSVTVSVSLRSPVSLSSL